MRLRYRTSHVQVFASAAALNKRYIKGINLFITTAFNLFYIAIILTIAAFIFSTPLKINFTMENISVLLGLGLLSTGIGYLLFFYLVNNAGLLFASFNSYLVPIFGFAMGVILLGEHASWHQFIGLLIAFIGMYFIQRIKHT